MREVSLATEAVGTCLRPWYQALKEYGSLELSAESRIAWIRTAQDPEQPRPVTSQFLEGLTLLALLANANTSIFYGIVRELWLEQIPCKASALDEGEPVTLGLDWIVGDYDELLLLGNFASSTERHSAAFTEAVMLIKDNGLENGHAHVSVCISADFGFEESYELACFLQIMIEYARTLPLLGAAGGVQFSLARLNPVIKSSTTLEFEGLQHLLRILGFGVSVDTLPPLDPDCVAPENAAQLVTALRAIAFANKDSSGLVETVIVSDTSPFQALAAVISSLHVNRTVKTLHLRMLAPPDGPRYGYSSATRVLWRLIARSLFSFHAQHRIETLVLQLPHMRAQAIDELLIAVSEEEAAVRDYCIIPSTCITATRFHLQEPHVTKEKKKKSKKKKKKNAAHAPTVAQCPIYESESPVEVRVLDHLLAHDGSEWWCCELPGWGEAWVASSDVVSMVDEVARMPTHWRNRRGFPEIKVELMSDESEFSVGELLVRIGHKTRKLVIDYQGREQLNHWCEQVLRYCEALEELRIYSGGFDKLELFVESAVKGYSRLRRLSLRNVLVWGEDDVCSFFQSLGDPQHPLAMHLQELDIELWAVGHDIKDYVRGLCRMLDNNRVLQKVSFGFGMHREDEDYKTRVEAGFSRPLTEKVSVCTAPLDARSKLVFLGVLSRIYDAQVTTIDSTTIATIFELAAPTMTREFRLHFPLDTSYLDNESQESYDPYS